jgi:mannose-6-phosphate isomerase-like protein (cupin superfamily)
MKKHNLINAFNAIEELWSPMIVSELNGQAVKIAKVQGDFVMHSHEVEDEFFYVVKGQLSIEMEDETIILEEGECITIPRGRRHRPFAETETWIILFEPSDTLNTGEVDSVLTKKNLKRL